MHYTDVPSGRCSLFPGCPGCSADASSRPTLSGNRSPTPTTTEIYTVTFVHGPIRYLSGRRASLRQWFVAAQVEVVAMTVRRVKHNAQLGVHQVGGRGRFPLKMVLHTAVSLE
jgi:hypothetical protein